MKVGDRTSERRTKLLHELFGEVSCQGDWKGPIDAVVERDMATLYTEAIAFMTATVPDVMKVDDSHIRLLSPGYRMGPAGP